MTISGMEAWVTSAVTEEDVDKAIVLAGSLRRVFTAKKLVVLTTFGISQPSNLKLRKAFDLVVPINTAAIPNGFSLEDYAKVEAFSLVIFSKCVFLSPNSLVLKNCDEIFENYRSFAALENGDSTFDSSIFLFTPSLDKDEAFRSAAHSSVATTSPAEGKFGECFSSFVRDWIHELERLEGEYNTSLDLLNSGHSKSLSSKVTIVNFVDVHPLNFAPGSVKGKKLTLGAIEHYAMDLCGRICSNDMELKASLNYELDIQSSSPSHSEPPYKGEPIAIVGMSFRLPASNNVDELWELLINGKEAIRPPPDFRWSREHTYIPCQNREVEAGFLSVPIDEFDGKFFGISGLEAEFMDPQQRILHEVAWEALEDAMIDPASIRGTNAGIFVGSWLQDYRDMVSVSSDLDFFRVYLGNSIGAGAARLSHFFETTGPSIATESGCSSAMVAVDMACKSLRRHDSTLALAAGVNLLLHPFDTKNISFVFSPEGRSRTFDAEANGFGRAEGCAVLVLKRLGDAVRDSDHIWGLIRGSAVTQEGVSKSIGTPTVQCESLAMELALADAQVDPMEVSYVEAHGTGTPVGDPLEIAAIAKTYSGPRTEPLLIGSVKTNLGHTESVAGLAGMIKVILAFREGKIPPHLNLKTLNPAINLEPIPAAIPLEVVDWPRCQDKARIAGVSSFGITGSNTHVIIQEPPDIDRREIHGSDIRPLHFLKLSAKSPESFQELLSIYEQMFDSMSLAGGDVDEDFANLAYSANTGRASFNHRAVIIAKDFEEASKSLKSKSFLHGNNQSGGHGQLCFLFTGQGSQYPKMGQMLYSSSPIFRDEFDKCDAILTQKYGIQLKQVMWGDSSHDDELSRTLYSQTSIFCIEYCLLQLWGSWGVKPDYVMGHSLGEFAAAVAAGALEFEDALMLVAERSRLIDNLPEGKMLVVRADEETVDKHIEMLQKIESDFWVDYAAINAPDQTVIAGDSEMIEKFAKFCEEQNLKVTILAASHAFHSRHMDDMLEAYRSVAQSVKKIKKADDSPKYISGMEGKLVGQESIDAEYWVRHTRQPVNFIEACKAIQSEGCSLFLELGPHPVLSALTMMNLEGQSVTCIPSLRRKEQEWKALLEALAKLYLSDWKGEVDWKGFDRYYKRDRVRLPFYPFNRKSVWTELDSMLPTVHPLVGKPRLTECDHTIFENRLTLKNTPFTKDHVLGNTVVFPGAGFLEMCLAGGCAATQGMPVSGILRKPQRPVALKSLRIAAPLALHDSGSCRLQTTAKLEENFMEDGNNNGDIGYSISVHRHIPSTSEITGDWKLHASAKYFPVPTTSANQHSSPVDIQSMKDSWEEIKNVEFYDRLREVGLRFGPKFQSLETGWKCEAGMLVQVKVPEEEWGADRYLIHPIIADAMIQATMLWGSKDKDTKKVKLQVPIQIGEFVWLQTPPSTSSTERYIHCGANPHGKIQSTLLDGDGNRLAEMSDVETIETTVKLIEELIQQQSTSMPMLWKEVWKSAPGPLQSSYELYVTEGTPLLQFDERQKAAAAAVNDVGEHERSFYNGRCELTRLYFLKAMYEAGWVPHEGSPFSLEELMKLLPKAKGHIKKYVRFFLDSLVESGMLKDVENELYCFVGHPPTKEGVEEGLRTVINPEDTSRAEYRIIAQVGSSLSQVLLGEADPLTLIFHEDPSKVSVHQFYEAVSSWVKPIVNELMDALFTPIMEKAYQATEASMQANKSGGSGKPTLRILEVGAGTGINSECFLEFLHEQGKPFEYYYTDVSASFFIEAERRFQKYSKSIIFKKFDMEEDPLVQGFCPDYFDVIVACEVLHVSKDLRRTLRNLKYLAKSGATFSIVETTQPDFGVAMTFGLLEGYWRFEDFDLRPNMAIMSTAKWEEVLKEMECEKVTCVPVYNNLHTYIAARFPFRESHPPVEQAPPQFSWLIFYHESTKLVMERLREELGRVGRSVHPVSRPPQVIITEENMKEFMKAEFNSAQEPTGVKLEGVIYLWGLSNEFGLRDQSQVSLPMINLVQEMVECKQIPKLYVVTQGIANVDEFDVSNPAPATLHGILKSLSNENTELQLRCLDLSPNHPDEGQVHEIFYALWPLEKGNRSVAFRDGNRFFAKFVGAKVIHHEPLALPSGCDRFQLILPSTRMISDLEFGVLENHPLKEHEIEVQVKASGLNFADVFTVLKPAKVFEDFQSIAMDFAGVVTKLGEKVTLRKVGDRVSGLNLRNKLSMPSHFIIDEDSVVPLPPTMTYEEGVTLPLVFCTAIYCLVELANVKEGETVLIHTGSGGVGLCAIQLARNAGANIIATAGSKRKQNYLRGLGIQHVFHSRTTDFGREILEVTNNNGVDIVLNSLTGEGFKEASLSALTRNGRFIEMSKLNVWSPEEIGKLRPDVFYKIADFKYFEKSDFLRLLGRFEEYVGGNSIQPIAYERFDAVNIRGALHYLQRAKHIGKIVCRMPEVKIENSKITAMTPLFNEVSTYIITGGLGGIGFALAKWMLGCGAKHIVLAGRMLSPPKPEVERQIENWNKGGKHVEAYALDVGEYDQCRELFQKLAKEDSGFPQIRGVMHAAGVLSDAIMENQSWSSFRHTYNSKVEGSWNLHDLTKDLLLEHFVVFSSMTALIGTPGQCNHAASNSFEDSLVAYRRSIGLPGTTVNWGTWGEVGVATEIDLPGFRPITTSQGILALETFLKCQLSHISVANMESFSVASKILPNLKYYVDDKKLFGEVKTVPIINCDEFWKEVDSAEDREEKVSIFKNLIKSILRNILKMGQDETIEDLTEFQEIGIDSLMTLEMKNGLQNILCPRMTLTAAQLKDCNNTDALANRLVDILEGDLHKVVLPTMEELRELVMEDCILPDHITPTEDILPATELPEVETVLMLGATGALGPYLLRELCRRSKVTKIYCLVRKSGKMTPTEKLLKRLQTTCLDDQVDMSKVECIQGDIAHDRFGLPEQEYNDLAGKIEVIINSAVRSDHLTKYYKAPEREKTDLRSVNVKGTLRVLEFAVHTKLKHVYHASSLVTIYSFVDLGDGTVSLSEDWQEPDIIAEVPYNTGYPLSKHVAEQLCRQAVDRGVPCKAFRFPVIGGDSKTGRCEHLTNHVMLRWLTFLKLGCMPDSAAPFLVIPVDHCAQLSLEIFFHPGALFDVFNISHPRFSVDQCIIGVAEKELGITIQAVSMPEFLEKLSEEKDDSPLAPFKKLYQEEANESSLFVMGYLGCMKDSPNFFNSSKLAKLISNYGKLEPTEEVVARDIRFVKKAGAFEKFGIKL